MGENGKDGNYGRMKINKNFEIIKFNDCIQKIVGSNLKDDIEHALRPYFERIKLKKWKVGNLIQREQQFKGSLYLLHGIIDNENILNVMVLPLDYKKDEDTQVNKIINVLEEKYLEKVKDLENFKNIINSIISLEFSDDIKARDYLYRVLKILLSISPTIDIGASFFIDEYNLIMDKYVNDFDGCEKNQSIKIKPSFFMSNDLILYNNDGVEKNLYIDLEPCEKKKSFSKNDDILIVKLVYLNKIEGGLLLRINTNESTGLTTHNKEALSIAAQLISNYFMVLKDSQEKKLEHKREKEKLIQMTRRDDLTDLYNKKYFYEKYRKELKRQIRNKKTISIIMIDIDDFKKYNDHFGHVRGDEVLKKVSRTLDACINRETDVLARYGGEEFIVMLPYTDEDGASKIAEKMRKKVKNLEVKMENGKFLTISLGIASKIYEYSTLNDHKELVEKADKALYKSKKNGKNQVTIYERT